MILSVIGKQLSIKYPVIMIILTYIYNHIPFNNRYKIKGKNNAVKPDKSILKNSRINIYGDNNKIVFDENCYLINLNITIFGSDNLIHLGKKTMVKDGDFYIEDSDNKILLDNHTCLTGKIHIACTEGCTISIGKDCLFSSDIVLRTGDSHSVLNLDGCRINHAKNIYIGDHVWVGYRVLINKGVTISDNSIVGTGAIVTKPFDKQNIIIGGVPAKIIKEDINWKEQRI
jgi:acetyltransferase-like isoleucine patch superfamily enzyme